MKIFKLKYLILGIVSVASAVSCTKDDVVKDADLASIKSSNSFEFRDDINNYIIDGKLTYDRTEVANVAKDAWNVHYDFSKNRVVISTTPAKFEEYKNSNPEFKAALLENDKASKIPIVEPTGPAKGANRAGDIDDYTNFEIGGISKNDMLIYKHRFSNYNTKLVVAHAALYDDDLTNRATVEWNQIDAPYVDTENIYDLFTLSTVVDKLFFLSNDRNNNTKLTKTFYKNTSYGGTSTSFTLSNATTKNVTSTLDNFNPKSYK